MTEENDTKPSNGTEPKVTFTAITEQKISPHLSAHENEEKLMLENYGVEPVSSISEAEEQIKKLPYPKSVFFIISNEFCERFNYYGMRTILVLYLTRQLDYNDDDATIIFHIFTMLAYFLCLFGAIISDSWLGKFKTILYLSIVYIAGSVMVTLGAIPSLNLNSTVFTMIGLALIALGSGGIKPCISAFGGDQFKVPDQVKQLTIFFSIFYFSINAGSLISTTVTPILREDVSCFGENECYSLAFGVPAVLMATSMVIFIVGRPFYKMKPPAGNMFLLVSKVIGTAISTKWKEKKINPRKYWLDYADKKFDHALIEDIKVLMSVLVLYLPLPFFWALFDQQGSRWTLQATRMNGNMGSWDIKPDQMHLMNSLLILAFIPLYEIVLYPLLSLIGIRRPLQKLTLGGIFASIAFIASALVELKLEQTYPVLPTSGIAQLRVYNGELCDYSISTNLTGLNFDVNSVDLYINKNIDITSTDGLNIQFQFNAKSGNNCAALPTQSCLLKEQTSFYLFLNSKNTTNPVICAEDTIAKPASGYPLVRTLANVNPSRTIEWKNGKGSVKHAEPVYARNITKYKANTYQVFIDNIEIESVKLEVGGIYTILVAEKSSGIYRNKFLTVTNPNSLSIIWQIPQYVIMTMAEVMFSVTGLEFSYSQAPVAMKSVVQACWLLTVAFGNVIIVVIAELSLFDSQASEFFLFAGLLLADMMLFMLVAYKYKPNNKMTNSDAKLLPAPEKKEHNSIAHLAKSNDE
ncbi:peptide transporter family 1-like [Eurosta solidaginis]|uniref:peptide transporter family 1-like n=1 Tax=Eurosta solidaginis TaxID=178769 RepID=UPI00353080CF